MSARLIVQKYGGSSLSTPARIREIAQKIGARVGDDTRIVVTVSAMGRSTDDLLKLAHDITPNPPQRELDMLLTVGERISMALLSMALNALNCPAISFTGSQSGIITNLSHTRAAIEEIRGDRLLSALSEKKVVIVAGFQGVSRAKEITTLGRGGSDTTAVAIAAKLGAAQCEIYSDFPGVFTADPRVVADARMIPEIGYDEMLELAVLGAKVLHYRAAEIARRYAVPLRLFASFHDSAGTIVREGTRMESLTPTSITCNPDVLVLRISAPDHGPLARVIERIGGTGIQLIQCREEATETGRALVLVVPHRDRSMVETLLEDMPAATRPVEVRDDLATVSIVGSGFACSARALAQIEAVLSEERISVYSMTTSSLSVTCTILRSQCDEVVRRLHSRLFGGSATPTP